MVVCLGFPRHGRVHFATALCMHSTNAELSLLSLFFFLNSGVCMLARLLVAVAVGPFAHDYSCERLYCYVGICVRRPR